MQICIAREFSTTPGPRLRDEGDFSGDQFLEDLLEPAYLKAIAGKEKLQIDLDGTEGYATSFLEAAFGGLARKHDPDTILGTLTFKCEDEPYLADEIRKYISEARRP